MTYGSNIFDGTPKEATLYVPKGTMTLYNSTAPWNEFANIVEEDDDSTGDVDGNGVVDVSDANQVTNLILGK